jgi:hypothetical protein
MFKGMRAAAPSYRHLCHWEEVCLYLDSQPYRSVSYPFPSDPPITARLLKRMAAYKLVRHRDTDCRWQLSPRWQSILSRLWTGALADEVANEAAGPLPLDPVAPFVADSGVDTLYVNLLSADGLPARLITDCDALKAQAQEEDASIETPWSVLGAPLSIYKTGKGTSGQGRGVSWSYILRNAQVMVLLRKTSLAELLGSVRLSSEALWTLGPRAALDGVRRDLRLLWGGGQGGQHYKALRWQVSQIHLCADVANFVPIPIDLERVLTRSLKKAIYFPSATEVDLAFTPTDDAMSLEPWELDWAPPEWAALPLELLDQAGLSSWQDATDEALEADGIFGLDHDQQVDACGADEESAADKQGATVHLWGQRASGFAFSPGAALSAVFYDKLLEEQRSGKRWMEPIHRAGGWEPQMPLTRVEARFRRTALRELRRALGSEQSTLDASAVHVAPSRFEDPWQCLEHLGDLWGYFAGLPPEADRAPDVTFRGWLRLAVPAADDGNRSRWPTDPTWETIQRAVCAASQQQPLRRDPRAAHDLTQVDAELYGLLKLRAVLRGEYLDATTTLSQELHAFAERMDNVDAERGRDFAEDVREKARMLGRAVPLQSRRTLGKRKEMTGAR